MISKKDDNSKIVFNEKSPTIFEKYYEVKKEYNIQYFIDKKEIKCLGSSYQLISKSKNGISYLGNYYTKSSLLNFKNYLSSLEHLLKEIMSFGFYGVIGIDAFETKRGEFIFSEMNPRMNGSTYYLPVIKKIQAASIVRSFLTLQFKITYVQMYDLLKKHEVNLIENMKKGKNDGIFILDSSGFSISDRSSSFSYLICGNSSDEIFNIYSIFTSITNCDKHCKEVTSIIKSIDRNAL